MAKSSIACAGIDTGKRKLDVALAKGAERLRLDNDAAGYVSLLGWLRRHRVKRVGIEASGGYEAPVVAELRRAGFVVIVFQPAQVRAYAKFVVQRAKNDRIDADLIARCTAAAETIHAPPDPRLLPLAEHLRLIEQLGADIVCLKTRRETCRDRRIRDHWSDEIARLKALCRRELNELVAAIRRFPDLAVRLDLIASIAGIGLPTAVAIVVRLPEIGRLTREQAAALAGLAPYDDDSGDRVGARHIDGGRQRLRKALYAAALPAAFHWNDQLKTLYKRLSAAGKPHKVALIACARKLLIYANTVVQRGTPWRAKPATA
jgi:transposase